MLQTNPTSVREISVSDHSLYREKVGAVGAAPDPRRNRPEPDPEESTTYLWSITHGPLWVRSVQRWNGCNHPAILSASYWGHDERAPLPIVGAREGTPPWIDAKSTIQRRPIRTRRDDVGGIVGRYLDPERAQVSLESKSLKQRQRADAVI